MSDFRLTVNGQDKLNFLSGSLSRSIDNMCGEFRFTTSFRPSERIEKNDLIQIYINDTLKLSGFQDILGGDRTVNTKTRLISGRDVTQDLVDSNVPPSAANSEGGTLKGLVEKVVAALGLPISVIEDLEVPLEPFESFEDEDIESSALDQFAFTFLSSFARKRQVYLITDPGGNIVIFRPNDKTKLPSILNIDNMWSNKLVQESSFRKYYNKEFAKITCGSQESLVDSSQDIEGVDIIGVVDIDGVRPSRQRQIIAEEAMNNDECIKRATEEANILKMASEEYVCTVQGVTSPDGTVWEIGQQINIVDSDFGIRGMYLLKAYTMSLDLNGGTATRLNFTRPSSYQPFVEVPNYIARKSVFEPESVGITVEDVPLL